MHVESLKAFKQRQSKAYLILNQRLIKNVDFSLLIQFAIVTFLFSNENLIAKLQMKSVLSRLEY